MSRYHQDSDRRKPEPQLKWLERSCDDLVATFWAVITMPFRVFLEKLQEDPKARKDGPGKS